MKLIFPVLHCSYVYHSDYDHEHLFIDVSNSSFMVLSSFTGHQSAILSSSGHHSVSRMSCLLQKTKQGRTRAETDAEKTKRGSHEYSECGKRH